MIERLRVRYPSGAAELSSPVSTFCAGFHFGNRSTVQHVNDPGHSAKRVGGRLHLNTYVVWNEVTLYTEHSSIVYTERAPTRQQFHMEPQM